MSYSMAISIDKTPAKGIGKIYVTHLIPSFVLSKGYIVSSRLKNSGLIKRIT